MVSFTLVPASRDAFDHLLPGHVLDQEASDLLERIARLDAGVVGRTVLEHATDDDVAVIISLGFEDHADAGQGSLALVCLLLGLLRAEEAGVRVIQGGVGLVGELHRVVHGVDAVAELVLEVAPVVVAVEVVSEGAGGFPGGVIDVDRGRLRSLADTIDLPGQNDALGNDDALLLGKDKSRHCKFSG